MRIALGIEYDGTLFSGWQRQTARRTIQAHVEQALSKIAGQPLTVICAGRTDAGVHALEQVIHFDTDSDRIERAWVMGTNTHLPSTIRVIWARFVNAQFHARYSATARFYRYIIANRTTRPALDRHRATWCYYPLNADDMQRAAQHLIGHHDFSSYRAKHCQSKSPERKMYAIRVRQTEDRISIDLVANAFLHHMIRNIAGVLIAIGAGKKPVDWSLEVLQACDRKQAGITAAPDGLYLGGILYPAEFKLPKHTIFEQLPEDIHRYGYGTETMVE